METLLYIPGWLQPQAVKDHFELLVFLPPSSEYHNYRRGHHAQFIPC